MFDWLLFFEVLIGGLLSGVMYSLVALGFVLIFKASGVFNFAQGALVLFAALSFVVILEMGEGGTHFWTWTGWLAVVFASLALLLFAADRTKSKTYMWIEKLKAPSTTKRFVIIASVLTIVIIPFVVDGGHVMWRSVFVVLLIFLSFTLGLRQPKTALVVLSAVALLAFFAEGINFWRSLALTLALMIALAQAIEGIVLRQLVNQEHIILFMATIGLNYVLEGIAQGVWDAQVHGLDIGIEDMPFDVGGIYISKFDVFAAITAGALVTSLAIFFSKTRIGRALRAVADDHQAALTVGIPLQTIWGVVWGASGIVALVAGLLWGSKLGVQFSLVLLAYKALPVLILGGFTSVPGAIVGGLLVGATEKLFEFYIGIPILGGGTESWSPYMLALLFLLFRPQGLFGDKIIERV